MSGPDLTPLRVQVRGAVFVALAAWILLAPALPHVLGRHRPYARDWMLYHAIGVGVIEARFFVRGPDGDERPLDRFAALGVPDPRRAPQHLRRIDGEAGLHRVAQQLCAALGPGAQLRAHARIATETGWLEIHAGERDLCGPQPPHPVRPGAAPRGLHD